MGLQIGWGEKASSEDWSKRRFRDVQGTGGNVILARKEEIQSPSSLGSLVCESMQGHLAHNWEGLESVAFSCALVLGPWEGELGPYRNLNGRIPCVGSHCE